MENDLTKAQREELFLRETAIEASALGIFLVCFTLDTEGPRMKLCMNFRNDAVLDAMMRFTKDEIEARRKQGGFPAGEGLPN